MTEGNSSLPSNFFDGPNIKINKNAKPKKKGPEEAKDLITAELLKIEQMASDYSQKVEQQKIADEEEDRHQKSFNELKKQLEAFRKNLKINKKIDKKTKNAIQKKKPKFDWRKRRLNF
ncbi:hypothetical protein MHBO_000796 [Bonamia ostreae]|uniref:Uncharacterized protein n=1 Tax=Bonamia ostreae TaxID=126728 RepID=A0ABV2AGU7_9EUKA